MARELAQHSRAASRLVIFIRFSKNTLLFLQDNFSNPKLLVKIGDGCHAKAKWYEKGDLE